MVAEIDNIKFILLNIYLSIFSQSVWYITVMFVPMKPIK